MARKEHTYHYIYRTTCNVTGRYYIGMHSTSNLKDGYIGSGRRLWLSINKHGKENHSVEILEWLPDRYSLKLREEEIVNEDLLKDEMCMNLQIGGGGGFINDATQLKCSSAGGKGYARKLITDPDFRNKISKMHSEFNKKRFNNGIPPGFNCDWTGRKHSDLTKNKIGIANSISQKGELNSQYGKKWIHHLDKKINKFVMSSDVDSYITVGWALGRKMKFS